MNDDDEFMDWEFTALVNEPMDWEDSPCLFPCVAVAAVVGPSVLPTDRKIAVGRRRIAKVAVLPEWVYEYENVYEYECNENEYIN